LHQKNLAAHLKISYRFGIGEQHGDETSYTIVY